MEINIHLGKRKEVLELEKAKGKTNPKREDQILSESKGNREKKRNSEGEEPR